MADLASGPGLLEQIRLVSQLRWRVLRNSLRKKSRRLDLIGVVISSVIGTIFVAGISVVFFLGTRGMFANHLEKYFGLLFLALLVWWQIFPIMIAGFSPQFPFRTLLRFPLKLSAFYLISIAYGLADSAALPPLCGCWRWSFPPLSRFHPPRLSCCWLACSLSPSMSLLSGSWVHGWRSFSPSVAPAKFSSRFLFFP